MVRTATPRCGVSSAPSTLLFGLGYWNRAFSPENSHGPLIDGIPRNGYEDFGGQATRCTGPLAAIGRAPYDSGTAGFESNACGVQG